MAFAWNKANGEVVCRTHLAAVSPVRDRMTRRDGRPYKTIGTEPSKGYPGRRCVQDDQTERSRVPVQHCTIVPDDDPSAILDVCAPGPIWFAIGQVHTLTSGFGGAGQLQREAQFVVLQVPGRHGHGGTGQFHGHVTFLDELLELFRDP